MESVLALFGVQGVLGALDSFWHHEWTERLPARPSARIELSLHAIREALYAVVFVAIAWWEWHGVWAILLAMIMLIEVGVTLADFLEEDRTRKLPPFERALHTVLAVNYGAVLGLFAPQLWVWAQQSTAAPATSYGWLSLLMTVYGVGVGAWSIRNVLAVRALGKSLAIPMPPRGVSKNPRTVLIPGGTGFIGRALIPALVARGDRVIVQTRDPSLATGLYGHAVASVTSLDMIASDERIDVVIGLSGAMVAVLPWTRRRKRTLIDSRLAMLAEVRDLISRLQKPPKVLTAASAVGYYGDCGDAPVDETTPPQPVFMSELCQAVESAAGEIASLGPRVCALRIGLVLDAHGGVLPNLARPARFGFAAILGTGRQWMPWITRDDLVRLILTATEDDRFQGAVNAVAPGSIRHADFMHSLGRLFRRPVRLKIPAAPLRLAMGEMADLLLAGQCVTPAKALAAGFTFAHPDLPTALAACYPPLPIRPVDGVVGDDPTAASGTSDARRVRR